MDTKYLKLAIVELCLEQSSPLDSALFSWAYEQDDGVVKMFADRFLCDRLRVILFERAEQISKYLPEELHTLQSKYDRV